MGVVLAMHPDKLERKLLWMDMGDDRVLVIRFVGVTSCYGGYFVCFVVVIDSSLTSDHQLLQVSLLQGSRPPWGQAGDFRWG